MSDLPAAIARVLNQHSAENVSNTPDYILGQFLDACLSAFDAATQQRETWYGRDARPTLIATAERAGEPVLRKFDHASEDRAKLALYAIGEAMGYGWAQAELGAEWERRHDCAPRGRMGVTVSDAPPAPERAAAPPHSVDCIGIALDLEDRARTVESQTAQRAMLRGAQALRTLYAHPPLAAERAAAQEPPAQAEPQEGDLLHTMMEWARTEEGRKQLADAYRPRLWACAKRVADPQNEAATCRHWCGDIEHCQPIASAPAQAEPQPEAIPIAPVEVVRQALKELLESISECRMDQVTARFAKASVMARAALAAKGAGE